MRDRDVLYCFLFFWELFIYFSMSDSLNYKDIKVSHSAMGFKPETTNLQIKVAFYWTRPRWKKILY